MKKLQLQIVGKGERPISKPNYRTISFKDIEVLEMIADYMTKHELKLSSAVEELITIAFETIAQDRLEEIVRRVRDKNRAALASSTFDFRKDCFGCGAKNSLVFVHGHVQCRSCGANVEPCCE